MSAAHATVDLDDTDGLLEADRGGLLRAAATAGAQVRATASAVEEGALDSVTDGDRPRTVIRVAGRGPAESAGAMLAAGLSGVTGSPTKVHRVQSIVLTKEGFTGIEPTQEGISKMIRELVVDRTLG
jgi:hypothetical protein